MSFISYAQNFEDVMLWRALKHIKNGTYIDVGAQDPIADSVSKAFYEHGWRGIHIEPVPEYAELLRKDRPDELVLEAALSDIESTLELNVILNTGFSTVIDTYAKHYQTESGYECKRIQISALTLKTALTSLIGKDVHWLKIDVEGLEEKVLRGWDSQTLRPWIVVVEATIPNSSETNYASWEPILITSNYQFVYFDGLNRFYIAQEHSELLGSFSCPPNIFDNFQLLKSPFCNLINIQHDSREQDFLVQKQTLSSELNNLKIYNKESDKQIKKLQNYNIQLQDKILSLQQEHQKELNKEKEKTKDLNYHSHYWWSVADKLTQQIEKMPPSRSRAITRFFKFSTHILEKLKIHVKKQIKFILKYSTRCLLAHPKLKEYAIRIIRKHPVLKAKIPRILTLNSFEKYNNFLSIQTTSIEAIEIAELINFININLNKRNEKNDEISN
jgi:FkbM family methyltransferase